jgi:hypothetical protein
MIFNIKEDIMHYKLFWVLIMLSSWVVAQPIVDIHGLSGKPAQDLLQKYTPQIQSLESDIMKELWSISQGHPHFQRYACLVKKKQQLVAAIRKEGHFGFVDLQTVYYYQNETLYTTLEVIPDPNDERMRLLSPAHLDMKTNMTILGQRIYRAWFKPDDLMNHMQRYEALVTQLSLTHQLDRYATDCPAYHCLSSFEHPGLRPYWQRFQQGVIRDKAIIINTLRHDLDPNRRAAAALLLGYFQDPKEIVSTLSASISDTATQVRNNALRVILFTLFKTKQIDSDCMPYIRLLASPYVTDRNKALSILQVLASNPVQKKKIIQHGGHQILVLLQTQQPDNHDLAYTLIQKLSNQHFGAHDYAQWSRWLRQAQERLHAF